MNVPPVAPIHTEWRSCGPPRGFSLPLCFNDSDSDLSNIGTPVPEKVQMIIESLRSTQSSLEMGDETEGDVLSGQEARPQGCKARRLGGPVAGPMPKCRGPTDARLPEMFSPVSSGSQDSDSDDSVDRGIEEAIQEYLKEKDGHKRKAEPATNVLPPSKILRKDQTFQEVPNPHSKSIKVLTTSNQAPKIVKTEAHTAPLMPALKKPTKSKAPLKENPLKIVGTCKGTAVRKMSPALEQRRGSSIMNSVSDKVTVKAAVKLDEDSPDSSSDDGIEEAIQLYQLEKKEERHELGDKESYKPLVLQEEDSDSSSDDGIEDAIRSYQLEKQNENKIVLKPSSLKQRPMSKVTSSHSPVISNSTQEIKRNKLSRKKKKKNESHVESLLSTSANLKVNTTTTAELMCAEAILDISKAVMPEVFHPNVSLPAGKSSEASSLLISSGYQGNRSDDSSVDSEDGIEQEIRKFLEQKAQMHKRGPDDSSCASTGLDPAHQAGGPDGVNKPNLEMPKQSQKKATKLFLTQKKKLRREACGGGIGKPASKEERATEQKIKDECIPKLLTERDSGSSPSVSCQRGSPPLEARSDRMEQSDGDKSSSLDSDEDLDTAIKDLLKTKKKLKKKTRDLKLKSRKSLKAVEAVSGNTLQFKRPPTEVSPKPTVLKRTTANTKSRIESKESPRMTKSTPQLKHLSNKRGDSSNQASETGRSEGNGLLVARSGESNQVVVQIKDDSSSVDSDDSIELEIRKFLAEKAKVSTPMGAAIVEQQQNSDVNAGPHPLLEKDIKLENQLAEIPQVRCVPFPDARSPRWPSDHREKQDGGVSSNTPTALPSYPSSTSNLPRNPCLSSAFTHRSSPLEPADGAGPARTLKRRRSSSGKSDAQSITSEVMRFRPVLGPDALPPSTDSEGLRESQAIPPIAETIDKIQSPNPFHTTSPNVGETTAATLCPHPFGDGMSHRRSTEPTPITPVPVCTSARTNRPIVPFHCSLAMPASASSRPPLPPPALTPTPGRQRPGRYFMQGLVPEGHWGQGSTPGLSHRVVHAVRDQTTFVPLSASKTHHVQVKSREASEGKDGRAVIAGERENGRESETIEGRGRIGREEEDCVDETESDESRSPVKKQGVSTL